jgi:hypothetical protein
VAWAEEVWAEEVWAEEVKRYFRDRVLIAKILISAADRSSEASCVIRDEAEPATSLRLRIVVRRAYFDPPIGEGRHAEKYE